MSYFLFSSFPKRVLRYALSRLEILDSEDVDLENLDIKWGKSSTVDLQGVSLNIEVKMYPDSPRLR